MECRLGLIHSLQRFVDHARSITIPGSVPLCSADRSGLSGRFTSSVRLARLLGRPGRSRRHPEVSPQCPGPVDTEQATDAGDAGFEFGYPKAAATRNKAEARVTLKSEMPRTFVRAPSRLADRTTTHARCRGSVACLAICCRADVPVDASVKEATQPAAAMLNGGS